MAEKNLPSSTKAKRRWIEPEHRSLSIVRQCQLMDLARSSWYYKPAVETAKNLTLSSGSAPP